MASRTVNVRIPALLYAELAAFCREWHLPTSVAIRLGVTHLVQYPEQVVERLADIPVDPQHQAAWDVLVASMAEVNLEDLVSDGQWGG
jgi:hypothetical protein